jgi:pantothenate kinase
MKKRATGLALLLIAALLESTRYISAAIYGSGVSLDGGYGPDQFNKWLGYTSSGLSIWALLAFIIGIVYLIWAEYEEYRK